MVSTYLISISPFAEGGLLGSIATLGAGQCAAAGAAPGCVGLVTDEEEVTSIQFAFAITTEPLLVPESGMLGLLAFGSVRYGGSAQNAQRLTGNACSSARMVESELP